MKAVIGLIFLCCILFKSVHAQKCDTLNGSFVRLPDHVNKLINCTDSLGRKQGWWVTLNNGTAIKRSFFGFGYYWVGQFLNNDKHGTWVEVHKDGCMIYINQEVMYEDDRSVTIFSKGNRMKIFYNPDSSIVKSQYISHSGEDTIFISCVNKTNCTTKFNDHLLNSFPFSKLEIELYKVEVDGYLTEIRRIKRDSE